MLTAVGSSEQQPNNATALPAAQSTQPDSFRTTKKMQAPTVPISRHRNILAARYQLSETAMMAALRQYVAGPATVSMDLRGTPLLSIIQPPKRLAPSEGAHLTMRPDRKST